METLLVKRAPLVTGYGGQKVRDWANAALSAPYTGCAVQADTSQEFTDRRDVVVTRWRANMPPTADVQPTDRVVWKGTDYEITGEPERPTKRGVPHHVELVMTRVEELV